MDLVQKNPLNTSDLTNQRLLTIGLMYLEGKLTTDEYIGLSTMLNTSVAETFISDRKAGK